MLRLYPDFVRRPMVPNILFRVRDGIRRRILILFAFDMIQITVDLLVVGFDVDAVGAELCLLRDIGDLGMGDVVIVIVPLCIGRFPSMLGSKLLLEANHLRALGNLVLGDVGP